MKLWEKEHTLSNKHTQLIESFTAGKDKEFDLLLAEADIKGSLAHARMLLEIRLLTKDEFCLIETELKDIQREVKAGNFQIEEGIEDVHSQVEHMLTQRIGDAGKKIHSGRSRNDQVLLDIKLYIRSETEKIVEKTDHLFNTLQLLSETHKNTLLPGYTHFQVAMPSSFGLWFGAYAESLVDDLEMLLASYRIAGKNPLGSGAGFGSSFPLDRELTTNLLGLDTLNYNVVYAQMSRGKTEKATAMGLACIAGTLSKLAYDVCLYLSQNFGFISFPDHLSTGSSIMPHKKNPDVFELIRGKCNRIQALPNELTLIINNLPSGYHRDLQLSKECLFPAFRELGDCLNMAEFMIRQVEVKKDILSDEKYKYLWSVEAVNKEVLNGTPFREAYQKIGREISGGTFAYSAPMKHRHAGSMGNLCNTEIREAMNKLREGFRQKEK
ncbi:MAG TPA: argininosuccinate lyase [Bacteroidia bacterium]|jgi:argininosuccinate lyase|nr:argininosuccinate lyase [Bacteroidia bacterium]